MVPAVNQIEVHPFHAQNKIVGYCRDKGIVVQAFAPLAKGLKMQDPTLVRVAAGYGVSVARLMLRWGVQRGIIILPKSSKKERILENMMVDFEISGDDMEALAGLDEGLCTGESFAAGGEGVG